MDTLTHALSGALLARAVTPAGTAPGTPGVKGRVLAGFVGGAFPDIDFVMRAVDTLWYLSEVHQGATHSLILLPVWAVLIAWVFGRFTGLGWRGYLLPVVLGIGIHIVGDLITAYGTMVLYPFSQWRPALSWVYVVDPYFTLIIIAGLAGAWAWPHLGRTAAFAALLILTAYTAMQGFVQHRAVVLATAYADVTEQPDARGHAFPQPFSPAHRMVVITTDDTYDVMWARLLPGRSLAESLPLPEPLAEMAAHYTQQVMFYRGSRWGRSPEETHVARLAWERKEFRRFRRFARMPVLHEVTEERGGVCAWFKDLRFTLPGMPPSFVFGMCHEFADGTWHLERRRGAMWLD